MAGAVIVAGLAAWLVTGAVTTAAAPDPPPASVGIAQDRAVPQALLDLPLRDQGGQVVPLSHFRSRVVFLLPFLTSCQEECPITTGALLSIRHDVQASGLGSEVAFVEVTVDPGRDTPSRMAAYARMTGADWTMLTGSAPDLARLWRYFGIYYRKVPEPSPPGIDWQTGRPYTYDVQHSDGFIVLDASQHERFLAAGMVKVASVPSRLRRLLNNQGIANLQHPGGGSWTIQDGLDAIGWVLGRAVPRAG